MTVFRQFSDAGAEAIRLLCGERRRVDGSNVRRILSEAMQAWPGELRESWWKWILETCRGLGFAARVIDATPREVLELLRHDVVAVTLGDSSTPEAPRILALNGTKRRKFRLMELPQEPSGRWISQRGLIALTGGGDDTTLRRWVILNPMADDIPLVHSDHVMTAGSSADSAHNQSAHHDRTPWSRLREFLQPEISDILIVLIFAVFTGLLSLATPIAVEALVNTVAFGTLLQPLIVLSVILLVFLFFAGSLRFLQRFTAELIQRRLFARTVSRLAWQLPRVRMENAGEFTPELLNRFFDIVTMQKIVAQLLLDGLTVVLTVGLGMIVLAFYHPWLLAFDAVLLLMLGVMVFLLGRGAVRSSITESQSKYAVASLFEDIARCPVLFRTSGGAELALSKADLLATDYLLARQAHFRILTRQIISGLLLEAFASSVLLGLGGFLVVQGQMTLGQLVAAELIVTLIVAAVSKFDKHLEAVYDLLTSMDKLGHLFDLPGESTIGMLNAGRTGAAAVAVCDVEYRYADGTCGLNATSFELRSGECVAITGGSGTGKSTLMDLLFRSKSPVSGRILLDDLNLDDLRPDIVRQVVALVRDVEILDASLAENVHLSRPDVTAADVRRLLTHAGLLNHRDDGLHGLEAVQSAKSWSPETRLDFRGRPLSDCQQRRLMIARALAGNPGLLLIDGLLDTFPPDEARALLERLRADRSRLTILLATARPELAAQCDRSLVLGEQT